MSLSCSYKGVPHHDYQKHFSINVEKFFKQLPALERGEVKRISDESGIPYETIRRWNIILQTHPDWSPINNHWGEDRRYFTDDEEASISMFITDEYVHQHQIFTNQEFISVIASAWAEKNKGVDPFPSITISNKFIKDFKNRNGFSSRRPHLKRRSPTSQKSIRKFVNKIKKLLKNKDNDLVFNVDETNWQLVPRGILTWSTIGEENVEIDFNMNEKESITVVATITASGKKLPLQFIAKGTTNRCEISQLGGPNIDHYSAHSTNGWTTNETFSSYLHHLRRRYPARDGTENYPRLHLILDLYSVHRSQEIIDLAKKLNIKLYFIPPSCTDELQPLDRRCFGALKAYAKRCFRDNMLDSSSNKKVTKIEAVDDVQDSWNLISNETLRSAWSIYRNAQDEDENPFGNDDEEEEEE